MHKMLKIFIIMIFIVNISIFQCANASDILIQSTLRPMASRDSVAESISHAIEARIAEGLPQANYALDKAIDEISSFKDDNRFFLDISTDDNPFVNSLQSEAQRIYEKYKIYLLPTKDRLMYCNAVFDEKDYFTIQDTVNLLSKPIAIDTESANDRITFSDYYYLANVLSETEQRYSVLDNSNIRFAISLVFDLWDHEKRILEQRYLIEEIDKELTFPGSGNLPLIVAMQDIHGGTRRALSLVGFALGLPADSYGNIRNLDDLKSMLKEYQIDINKFPVRFIGFNDKYDRGNDPVGAFELVKWLRETGKTKPLIGNHDFWRTMAVLGMHMLFEEYGIDYNHESIKNHHLAYWARDAFEHAGWGDIELEQINQRRFNLEVELINEILKKNELNKFELINLAEVRNKYEKKLKEIKNKNAEIRTQNENRKDEAGYTRQPELELPNILQQTLGYLRDSKDSYNQSINTLNSRFNLGLPDIAFDEVNLYNFWRDAEIIERALWELKNFRLFYVDILGNLHMHSLLPVDYEKGGFDVEYKGLRGLPALELMAGDVRSFFYDLDTIPDSKVFREQVWDAIGEVFTIVNSWYSDIDASAKIGAVKKFIDEGGLESLGNEILGRTMQAFVDRWAHLFVFLGHNERKKLTKIKLPWIYPYPSLGSVMANIDLEMSEGYADRGAIVTLFLRDSENKATGMRIWGYNKGSDIIEDLTFEDIEGLNQDQLEMLKNLSDGESFMRWYREKALELIEREAKLLKEMASERKRPDKEDIAETILLEQTHLSLDPAAEGFPTNIESQADSAMHLHHRHIYLSISKSA